MEGRRLKDRCKYLCTLIKLFHFCRKMSYCSFSGGKGGFGRTVQILPMLGCVRQLNRTGFFCVWLSCQVSVALIAQFTKDMVIIQMSVRIAGYLGKVSRLLQSLVGGKSVNLHVVCCHASLLQRWNEEKGLILRAVAAGDFARFYLWKF